MEHEHKWGDLERSRFSGMVLRRCKVVGCDIVNALDDDDYESDTLGSCGCIDYHYADCPTRQGGTGYGDEFDYEEENYG